MASIDRLNRANRTVLVVPIVDGPNEPLIVSPTGTTAPFSAPTSAVLSAWAAVQTTGVVGASHGGNVSCALLDDMKLGLGASETDTQLTICSIGNETVPTFYKVDADFSGLRDKVETDTGVFNLWTQLMNAPDIRYGWLDRIGKSSSSAFTVGDVISLYEGRTDNPVDIKGDKANLLLQQVPLTTGLVNVNYTLTA